MSALDSSQNLLRAAEAVQRGDPDRFLATMAAPVAARAKLWPLYALNLELARAPWASNEPMIAEMRLQWWIDALESLQAGAPTPPHAVLSALADLAGTQRLALAPLLDMAEARRRDCWRTPFTDLEELAAYLEATSGNLMWAAALALGAQAQAEQAVRNHAWGAGLANWFLAVPELSARGLRALPDPRPEAVAALATEGLRRLALARAARAQVSRAAAPALFAGWQARAVLMRAAKAPERVMVGGLALPEFRRRAGLLWPAFTHRW